MDGFDHYGTDVANLTRGVYSAVAGNVFLSASNPRTGVRSLEFSSNSANSDVRWATPAPQGFEYGVGFAFRAGIDITSTISILRLSNSSLTPQVSLFLMANGALRLVRGSSQTTNVLAETSPGLITQGAYVHLELRTNINDTTGSAELRVNGVTQFSISSVDTQASGGSNPIYFIEFNGYGASSERGHIDDFFVWDTNGSDNNSFLGTRHVLTLTPDSNEAAQGWTGNGSADIDELDPDDSTTEIVASDSTPVTSEFGFTNVPADYVSVAAIQTVALMKKDPAGDATVQVSALSGGSAADGSAKALTDSYTNYGDIHERNPDGNVAWTPTTVNAMTGRLRRTS